MIFSQSMTEIELIVPSKDMLPVTKLLANQGIFHQADASYLNSQAGGDATDTAREQASAYASLERRILTTMQTLGIDEGKPRRDENFTMLEVDAARQAMDAIEQEVRQVNTRLSDNRKKVERLQNEIHQLEPIADADFDVSFLHDARHLFTTLGVVPLNNLSRMETSLSRVPNVLTTLRRDRQSAVVLLVGARQNADILDRAARSAYLNPIDLPAEAKGTPAEVIRSLHESIRQTEKEIEQDTKELVRLRDDHQQELQKLLWQVRIDRMLADAMAHYGKLRYTYLIVGWIPTSRLESLRSQLKQISSDIIIETTTTERLARQDVPVALRNPSIFAPFQSLVTTFSNPRYNEIDPTFLIAITFPILYGAMFGDVGHGALLALLGGLVLSRRIKPLRGLASLGGLIVACGLFAVLFGFIYGSVFGLENVLKPLWLHPIDNITTVLLVAVSAGVIILNIGFILNLINSVISRDWMRFFFGANSLTRYLLYLSLIGLVLSFAIKGFPIPRVVFIIVAVVTGLLVMFAELVQHLVTNHRPLIEGGIATFFIQSFFELFEALISYLSNTLSYIRVGAFAVAHAGLAAVFFLLANMVSASHGVGYWIVLAIGTVFIVGFEGLIIGIQTMRLEYYEFFSKFFTGGGMLYKPLNVSLSKDEQ